MTSSLIKGQDFGPILLGAGTQGFYGDDTYPHTRLWKKLFPKSSSLLGATFVSKTTTVENRLDPASGKSNMYLKEDGFTPRDIFPDCVVWNPFTGDGLNAVGLAGMSLEKHLQTGKWQALPGPFMISIMAVGKTRTERVREIVTMARLIAKHRSEFRAKIIGIQNNCSCPNVGLNRVKVEFRSETHEGCDIIADELGWPLMVKLSPATDSETAYIVGMHQHCHGLSPTNTIAWGSEGLGIPWKHLFGKGIGPFRFTSSLGLTETTISPLAKYGGGGLSGPWLLPLGLNLIRHLRKLGFNKHLNGGGGIRFARDVWAYAKAGVDSVSYSTGTWIGSRNEEIVNAAYKALRKF